MTGLVSYLICFALLGLLFFFLPKKKQFKRTAFLLLALSLLFELFLANLHSYHLIGGDYEKTSLPLSGEGVIVTGATETEEGGLESRPGATLLLEYRDLDCRIGTLRLSLTMPETTTDVTVRVSASDETNAYGYRYSVADGRILKGDSRSSYITLSLSGNVKHLRIELVPPSSSSSFTLTEATLNEAVPMHLSALRLLLLVLGGMGVYLLASADCMKASYGECRRALRVSGMGVTVFFILAAIAIAYLSMINRSGGLIAGYGRTYGDQMTKELVDAFRAGQVHLLETPPDELLAMENPYDWSARIALGVEAKWDHLLYDGKYYSYYGIAPVLLLFLPYNLITGYYFPAFDAILLFSVVGLLFLGLLFLEFSEMYGKKIPNGILLSTLIVLFVSCGAYYNLVYDNFYEIAQSSGFCFTTVGSYFLLRSRVIGEGRIRYRYVVLATAALSLAVLCRPTLALYCVVACLFLAFGLFKHRRELAEEAPKDKALLRRGTAKYLASALTCFVVFGGIQMLYNYLRFGSILDFGIQYSLTINDFTRAEYHADLALIGFYNFLFAPPRISPEFPYVFSNFSTLSANGYYFIANYNAVGLFFRALPSLGYLGTGAALRVMDKQEKKLALCLLLPACVLAPLIIIFSIWESGYGVRYCCDFAWQFVLGGAAILFLLYLRRAEGQGRTLLRHAFTVFAVLAIVVNGAMIYDYLAKSGHLSLAYLRLERLFDFWQ